jgi:hypothetical protein
MHLWRRAYMTKERMELWSNDIFSEFAIKFNSTIVVNTSNNPDTLVKMIDECPYRSGYEFDWHYTLSQWIVYFLANKFTTLLDSKTSIQKEFNIPDDDHSEVYSLYNVSLVIKVKNKLPPKPGLKCHFCNLKYCLEEEREQHEEFWHSNKIKM